MLQRRTYEQRYARCILLPGVVPLTLLHFPPFSFFSLVIFILSLDYSSQRHLYELKTILYLLVRKNAVSRHHMLRIVVTGG